MIVDQFNTAAFLLNSVAQRVEHNEINAPQFLEWLSRSTGVELSPGALGVSV